MRDERRKTAVACLIACRLGSAGVLRKGHYSGEPPSVMGPDPGAGNRIPFFLEKTPFVCYAPPCLLGPFWGYGIFEGPE